MQLWKFVGREYANIQLFGHNCGTLFAAILIFTGYSAAQNAGPTLSTLYSFNGGSDGADPAAGLVIGSGPGGQPRLYGTTENGGNSNSGCHESPARCSP